MQARAQPSSAPVPRLAAQPRLHPKSILSPAAAALRLQRRHCGPVRGGLHHLGPDHQVHCTVNPQTELLFTHTLTAYPTTRMGGLCLHLPASGLPAAFSATHPPFGLPRPRSWAGSACTSPIFAEVVPSQLRSLVYSFDRAFEASWGMLCSRTAVRWQACACMWRLLQGSLYS